MGDNKLDMIGANLRDADKVAPSEDFFQWLRNLEKAAIKGFSEEDKKKIREAMDATADLRSEEEL